LATSYSCIYIYSYDVAYTVYCICKNYLAAFIKIDKVLQYNKAYFLDHPV